MIREEGFLEGSETEVMFNIGPQTSFTITVFPFPDDSDTYCEFTLYELIWLAVSNRIADKENPKAIASYLRMMADEIEGMCDEN